MAAGAGRRPALLFRRRSFDLLGVYPPVRLLQRPAVLGADLWSVFTAVEGLGVSALSLTRFFGLRLFAERIGAGEPVLDSGDGEELVKVQPGVSIAFANRNPESPGTLYISTKKVVWLSDIDMAKGYAVDFLSISLHAVSRDPEAYSSPCIYTQIENGADEDGESEDSDSEDSDILDLSKIKEMRLIPSDPNQLDTLFDIFCQCAELNPEPNSEGEEEHNWIFSADQLVDEEGVDDSDFPFLPKNTIGHSNGTHDLAHNVLELQINDQRASRTPRRWTMTMRAVAVAASDHSAGFFISYSVKT